MLQNLHNKLLCQKWRSLLVDIRVAGSFYIFFLLNFIQISLDVSTTFSLFYTVFEYAVIEIAD